MASTGLLGINPYRRGNVAIDISSKPTQLAINLMQKQQAKAEAVDKYFKDWEKSINPAGLSKSELDIFSKKLKEVQEYGIKNKQAITNPSKYGYDAQSTLMAGFKDLQGYIEQGKQATAERKAFKDYINQAIKSGKRVSDNYLDVMNNAMLPVGAGYTPPDMMQVDIYDPHDEKKFTTNVWGGIKLPTKEVFEKEIINNKPTGKFIKKTYETLDDNTVKNAMLGAINEYKTSKGTREHFDELFKDKDFTSQINEDFRKRFNKDISSGSDLAIGYALTQNPGGLIKTEAAEYDWETKFNKTQAAINSRAAADDNYTDPLTYLNQGLNVLGSKNEEAANNYFSNWKRQAKFSLGGDQIGFKDIKFIPKTDDFKVNYTIDVNKVAVPQSQQFNLKDPQLLAKLISLHQNFLGSDVKLEKSQNAAPKPKEIKRSEIAARAAAAGYTPKEYEKLLKERNIVIK